MNQCLGVLASIYMRERADKIGMPVVKEKRNTIPKMSIMLSYL